MFWLLEYDLADDYLERRATFRQAVGTWSLRPGATDGPDGVVLAGAWTDTGWPDTMEGAVRSGYTAAEAVLGSGAGVPDYAQEPVG